MYSTVIPESLFASVYIHGWNLGDVCITGGIETMLETHPEDDELLDRLLMAHLNGDYGLVNLDTRDLDRTNEARKEGRQFSSVFIVGSQCVKVVSNPSTKRTVVCLQVED